ncbi:hypothetical protein Ddc_11453 [Ditylenchus destructor]|nr:hypothetical protein Ddc_11453 [Ditylenchus destructor]
MKVEAHLFSKDRKAGLSFIKLDQSDLHPLYQIAVIVNDSNNYDEDLFYSAVNAAFQSIQEEGKLFKYAFFIIILAFLAGMAFRYQYKHSPRLRLLLSGGRSSLDQLSVNWQRTREMLAEESRVELRRANRRLSLLFGQLSGNHHQVDEEENEAIQELSDRSIFHAEFANQAFNDAITEEGSQSADITGSQTKIIEF